MKRWIPLSDYCFLYRVSLSTLRRRIKSNKIEYKKEKGKYLVLDNPISNKKTQKSYQKSFDQNDFLKSSLEQKEQEIHQLKQLIETLKNKIDQTH